MKKSLLVLALIALAGFIMARRFDSTTPAPAMPPAFDSGSRLSRLLGSEPGAGYAVAGAPRAFHFPADHGPHPDFRNEWWYLTGNLDDEQKRRFGYELTIFRFALSPTAAAPASGRNPSRWRSQQVYMAHFTITDASNKQFHVAQRFSRGALGLAGAQSSPFKVWVEDWALQDRRNANTATGGSTHWQLSAAAEDFTLDLNLVAAMSPVLNGIDGLSQKSAAPGNASYYYSIPRMRSTGTLRIAGETYTVTGLSWLDREWSSSALAPDQQGWDWFALQLADGSDLMFYKLRKKDGSQDPWSAGTWISADGKVRHLRHDDVVIKVTATWQSPGGGRYPAGWVIRLPALDLLLTVSPVIANQELVTNVRYWEGAVDVSGHRRQQTISGRGYVELTGYSP